MYRKPNEKEVFIHRGPYLVSTSDALRSLGIPEYLIRARIAASVGEERFVSMPCICLRCQWNDGSLDGVPESSQDEEIMRQMMTQVKDEEGIQAQEARKLESEGKAVTLKELQDSFQTMNLSSKASSPSAEEQCAQCSSKDQDALRNCPVCQTIKYCGRDFQLKHWKKHKLTCRKKQEAEDSSQDDASRSVVLPPEGLNTCAHCESFKPKGRKFCLCGEAMYCSEECQSADWKPHKAICVTTLRLDPRSCHVVLACLVEKSHAHKLKPAHKAFQKNLAFGPTPGTNPVYFPDKWEAAPVVLQKKPSLPLARPFRPDSNWWPDGVTPSCRENLYDRIRREGCILPILTSVCVALVAEMYTTTSPSSSGKPLRLGYLTSPVADFGISTGSARVTNQDKLGYVDVDEDTMQRGQEPDDHYWIYFRTMRGEELVLDCAMFTFNMNTMVQTGPYTPHSYGTAFSKNVPAIFLEREIRHNAPTLHTERARRSVLRDPAIQKAVRQSGAKFGFTASDEDAFASFMLAIARREVTATERKLVTALVKDHIVTLRGVFKAEEWRRYPEKPGLGIAGNPIEIAELQQNSEQFMKELRKQKKRELRKGGQPRPKYA